ncbi:MAG: hypothetical protein OXH63_24365 [Gemmatimonadetes bacterium]|nr:hypothetical protein [Gemmatimonadota bacterium]
METLERRKANLRKLAKAENLMVVAAATTIMFLPVVTRGTSFHERAITISIYAGLGILLAPAYIWWGSCIVSWINRTGRNFEGFWFLAPWFAGILSVGTAINYIAYRLLAHEGDWPETLAFSWIALYQAFKFNAVVACSTGFIINAVVHYTQGDNILVRDGPPTPFWHVVAYRIGAPTIAILMIVGAGFIAAELRELIWVFRTEDNCVARVFGHCYRPVL